MYTGMRGDSVRDISWKTGEGGGDRTLLVAGKHFLLFLEGPESQRRRIQHLLEPSHLLVDCSRKRALVKGVQLP